MFSGLLKQRRNRTRSRVSPRAAIADIRAQADKLQQLSDGQLRRASDDLRQSGQNASDNDADVTTSAFALATEAVRRSSGKVYYDVQLQAGEVLANGDLAEMATGEGKTLVTLLPVYRAVAGGNNVHVATTNSYLAERDCEELRPAFELLGVDISLLPEINDDAQKRSAYNSDVTYGTGYEFGFDYLRDQLLLRQQPQDRLGDSWLRTLTETEKPVPELVQSERRVTVVDEIDSVLIDEANTPLVISFFTDDEVDARPYRNAARVADQLVPDTDYDVNTTEQTITITESGRSKINLAQTSHSDFSLQRPWRIYVEQALRARYLLRRDIDYVLQDGAIALVDQQTGRIFPERKWRDGLHQAIEILENAELTAETNSFARISRQRFFKVYERATGMTGTATDAINEFQQFFNLNVVPIPLNRPSKRQILPMQFFVDTDAKYRSIIADTKMRHNLGQPVLIGTRTIQQSLELSAMLQADGLTHNVLNGLQDADESAIVAQAGLACAITVATNMAGRGTDIKLNQQARQAGGLHVIVAEPNRSHRVDRQLLGRCARQGDPGSCQIFVSVEDELLTTVGPSLSNRIRRHSNSSGIAAINGKRDLLVLQRKAEQIDFARRQHLMQQELWVEGLLDKMVGTG